MRKTRHLFSHTCPTCGGSGWVVSQSWCNPPERDGCPDCYQGRALGIVDGAWHTLRSRYCDLKLRLRRWWRDRRKPRDVKQCEDFLHWRLDVARNTPPSPPVVPLALRAAVDVARLAYPAITWRVLFSPAQNLWGVVAEQDGQRVEKKFTSRLLAELDTTKARDSELLYRELRCAAYELEHSHLPSLPCKRAPSAAGVHSVRDVAPLRAMLQHIEHEHKPDNIP